MREYLGGRYGNYGWCLSGNAFVVIGISFAVALAKTLALHFALSASHCFSEHSRAPRWKLRMPGVTLRLEKCGVLMALLHLLHCLGTSRFGSQVASADPSSSSRPLDVR